MKCNVSGVIFLDKPLGLSSNQALQRVKFLLGASKAGYAGTLDPLASGLLPIFLGQTTKYVSFLQNDEKTYWADIQLGATTTTADAEGEILTRSETRIFKAAHLRLTSRAFIGKIRQTAPIFSALKHQGQPLYTYARKGIEVEPPTRYVYIRHLETLGFDPQRQRWQLRVVCSKGTYVRTLAVALGEALGCGAYLAGLRREAVGAIGLARAVSLAYLADRRYSKQLLSASVVPVEDTLLNLPRILVSKQLGICLQQGQAISYTSDICSAKAEQITVLVLVEPEKTGDKPHFLGLAHWCGKLLVPKRLMSSV